MERDRTTTEDEHAAEPPERAHEPEEFRPQPGDEVSKRICYCMKVHEATIRRAVRAGARDLEALKNSTRAGTGCGTCRPDVLDVLHAVLAECDDSAPAAPSAPAAQPDPPCAGPSSRPPS